MIYKRTHPVLIFEGVKRLGFVFLLVLLRGFFTALDKGLSAWLYSAWTDIGITVVIFSLATLHWWQTRYFFDSKTIAVKGGLFIWEEKRIPLEKICSVTFEQPLFYRFFGATRVRFETLARTRKRADISLILPDKTARKIADNLSNGDKKTLTPSLSYIMVLSAFVSDSFAGAGLVAVFVTRLGALVGEELEKRLVTAINGFLHRIPSGLPPIAKTVAVAIILGWTIGFLLNLIRHHNLTLTRDKTALIVEGGALTKRTSKIRLDSINFITIQQGLFAKLLGICAVFGHSVGVGKKKSDITAITPAGSLFTIRKSLKEMFPEYKLSKIFLRPNKGAFIRFVADPLWLLIPIALITALIILFTEAPAKIVLSLATFVSIPAVWWLLVRIADLFSSGVGMKEDTLTLKYSAFLKLNTVLIKRENIIAVKFRQSLFQRIDKRCDVLVYTKGETACRHRVKNLDVDKARKLLRF